MFLYLLSLSLPLALLFDIFSYRYKQNHFSFPFNLKPGRFSIHTFWVFLKRRTCKQGNPKYLLVFHLLSWVMLFCSIPVFLAEIYSRSWDSNPGKLRLKAFLWLFVSKRYSKSRVTRWLDNYLTFGHLQHWKIAQ